MLAERGDWVPLGNADEQKPAADGTVEAWGRSADNPVGGWYGLKKGLRGRFANYVPPVLERLGLAEVEHNARNNRMRSLRSRDARRAGGRSVRGARRSQPAGHRRVAGCRRTIGGRVGRRPAHQSTGRLPPSAAC